MNWVSRFGGVELGAAAVVEAAERAGREGGEPGRLAHALDVVVAALRAGLAGAGELLHVARDVADHHLSRLAVLPADQEVLPLAGEGLTGVAPLGRTAAVVAAALVLDRSAGRRKKEEGEESRERLHAIDPSCLNSTPSEKRNGRLPPDGRVASPISV